MPVSFGAQFAEKASLKSSEADAVLTGAELGRVTLDGSVMALGQVEIAS